MRSIRSSTTSCLCALLLLSGPASAQTVTGRAVSELDGVPLRGAVVELRDGTGERRAAVLTDEHGGFRIRAPEPGLYHLAVGAMGYRTVTTGLFRVEADAVVTRTVEVPLAPIRLEDLRASGTRRCGRPRGGEDLARLWDQARRALVGVRITEEERPWTFELRRREVSLDPQRRIQADTIWTFTATASAPFATAPPDSVLRHGFVRIVADTITYLAPDAELVLSDAFLAGHCFRLVRDRGDVGLAFSPARKPRDRADIEGTLWLDEASAELRRLTFRYVNPPLGYRSTRPRGEIAFERLADGSWIIRQWWITFDRPVARRGRLTRRSAGVHVSSGRVIEVRPGSHEGHEGNEGHEGGVRRPTGRDAPAPAHSPDGSYFLPALAPSPAPRRLQ